MTFVERLKTALVGDPRARFVYLGNFEVERVWGRSYQGLPGAGLTFSGTVVNRMEEMGVLLAEAGDVVVLKAEPDPDYLAYLRGLDCARGDVLVVQHNEPERSVTGDLLASPESLAALRRLADGSTYLMPLGVSADEEALSEATGLPLAAAPSRVCVAVNGKVFSRRLVTELGLTPVPGAECESLDELRAALPALIGDGGRVVVKESLGVSGRGMVVMDERRRADRLLDMLTRRPDHRPVAFVVERWIDKALDLNYQFVVGRAGEVEFETVKAALVENGVHAGHVFPPPIGPAHEAQLREAAELIGKRLHEEGYLGVVGVDAMIGTDGTLYPCLEINARFNMATYQNGLAERLIRPGQHALAATLGVKATRAHGFARVRDGLADLLHQGGDGGGLVVNGFATLTAMATADRSFTGRLYVVCVADDAAAAADLRRRTEGRLQELMTR